MVFSSPAVSGGIVYVDSLEGNVIALNASTGALIWNYTTADVVFSSPAVVGGVVYVGSDDGKVYAFGVHDVAVTNVASRTVVGQGFNASINVTVANQGGYSETCKITVYANATIVGSQNITVSAGDSLAVTFTWNTSGCLAYDNYTISAYDSPVAGEMNTANNNCTGGCVIVTKPGDINGDFKVDLKDLVKLTNAYGSKPGDANWNQNADIDGNGTVGLSDLVILAQHYGQ
ncbi:MAG: PQQ-binding-like beta-propeller repeat protein [Candidatus Bathyarchaeia archaeon]|jgi:outer membrane protein assembly factor BamB